MISVLIPTVDRPALLGEAIASVERQQGVDRVELVIEHDTQRTGLSATLNRAFARSHGEAVTVLPDDDYFFSPTALRDLSDMLEAHPHAGAIFSLPEYVGYDGHSIPTSPKLATWMEVHPVVTWETVSDGVLVHGAGLLYRRSWWEQAGPWDEALPCMEEWEYHLRLLSLGCVFLALPKVTVAYRHHAAQKSGRRRGLYGRRSTNRMAIRRQIRARYQLQEVG